MSFLTLTSLSAQCDNIEGDCDIVLDTNVEYSESDDCIEEGGTTLLTINWSIEGDNCNAVPGSWNMKISFDQGDSYGIDDETVVTGPEFNWGYFESSKTLVGFSNVSAFSGQSGTVTVLVTGNTNNECATVLTNVNITTTGGVDLFLYPLLGPVSCLDNYDNDDSNDATTTPLGIEEPLVTLPVDLVAFNARKDGNTSILDWETRIEVNNERFDIMRSTDASRFVKIGSIQGNGNTSTSSFYTFRDENPLIGQNYYRLRQIDENGKVYTSEMRLLEFDQFESSEIRISPNPVSDILNVQNLTNSKVQDILIYTESGKLVSKLNIDGNKDNQSFNVSELAQGIYFLRYIGQQESKSIKLLKI